MFFYIEIIYTHTLLIENASCERLLRNGKRLELLVKPTIMTKPVTIIVAALKPQWGIGYQGKLPWRLKQEIKYFKQVTSHTPLANHRNVVIMGRKTWDSIPAKFRPLPNRINVVLSRSFQNEKIESDVFHANSLENSLSLLQDLPIDKIFIIGGGELYNQVIDNKLVNRLLITEIETNKDTPMDTFLKFNLDEDWKKNSVLELREFVNNEEIDWKTDIEEGDYKYNYCLYTRK